MSEPCIRVECLPFTEQRLDFTYRLCAMHGFHDDCPICAALDPLADFTAVPAELLKA